MANTFKKHLKNNDERTKQCKSRESPERKRKLLAFNRKHFLLFELRDFTFSFCAGLTNYVAGCAIAISGSQTQEANSEYRFRKTNRHRIRKHSGCCKGHVKGIRECHPKLSLPHTNYFELKAIEEKQTQEALSPFLSVV